jgi:hypothetical protein
VGIGVLQNPALSQFHVLHGWSRRVHHIRIGSTVQLVLRHAPCRIEHFATYIGSANCQSSHGTARVGVLCHGRVHAVLVRLDTLSYSDGLPLSITGALVSSADITPTYGVAWTVYMDTVQIKGSKITGLRQVLDMESVRLPSGPWPMSWSKPWPRTRRPSPLSEPPTWMINIASVEIKTTISLSTSKRTRRRNRPIFAMPMRISV